MQKKLKILYINNEAEELGGCSFSLLQLLQSVSDRVEPIILLRKKGEVYDFFVTRGYRVIIQPFCLNYISKSLKFRSILYPYKVLRNRLINWFAINRLFYTLSSEKIDIVHTNSSVIDLGYYLSRKLNCPHIWHIREFIDIGLKITPIGGYDSWLKKVRNSFVIAISKSLYSHLKLNKSSKYFCLEDAVVDSGENIISNAKSDHPYIVFLAGRVHPIKYPQDAIEIFTLSHLYEKGYYLYMIGRCSWEYRDLLLSSVEEKVRHFIVFQDFTYSVKDLLVNADALISSSRFEGLGRVMIEAMHYNCPVLSYNGGGGASIIEDGITGYLYNDLTQGASILKNIVEFDNKELLSSAKAYVDSKFSISNYGINLFNIYKEVLK